MSQEEKQGFLNKLKKPFKSHSRSSSSAKSDDLPSETSAGAGASASQHDHPSAVLEEAYREGQAKAAREHSTSAGGAGAETGAAGFGAAGVGGAAAAGAGASHGHTTTSSSAGRVLSSPPKVRREPIPKGKSGDYTNEKTPTDLVSDTAPQQENYNPHYDNDADQKDGSGTFFHPKDTQGEGTHHEATRAFVEHNRNLKTKPTQYAHEEKQQAAAQEVKDSAYTEGVKQGHEDAAQSARKEAQLAAKNETSQSESEGAQHQSLDPKEEHSKNKSAFNAEGVDSAKKELGVAGAGGAAGAAGAAGAGASGADSSKSQATSSHNDKSLHSATNDDSYVTNDPSDKQYLKKSVPPSSDNFDYDTELERLDKQIGQTQKEIDRLQNPNASTTGVYNADLASKQPTNADSGSNNSGKYASTGVLAAAASYIGLGGKTHEASDHPVVKEAYEAGLKAGHDENNTSTGSYGTKTVDTNTKTLDPATNTNQHSESPGFFGGALGAASAIAAGTLGFGSGADDEQENQRDLQASKEDSVTNEAYQAGKDKASTEKSATKDTSSSALEHDSIKKDPKEPLDKLADSTADDTRSATSDKSSGSGLGGILAGAASAVGLGGAKGTSNTDATKGSSDSKGLVGAVDDKPDVANASAHTTKRDPIKEAENQKDKEVTATPATESSTPYPDTKKLEKSAESHKPESEKSTEKSEDSEGSQGYLAAAGAVAGAAVAGVSKSVSGSKSKEIPPQGESLIATAERTHKDVAEASPHHTSKNPLKDSEASGSGDTGDGVQAVPGLTPSSESKEDSDKPKASDKAADTSKITEKDVDAHNKKLGFNKKDKRSLVEIAEEHNPEIKNASSHVGKPIEEAEEGNTSKGGDVQEVPLDAYKGQNRFIATGGKEGSLNDSTANAGKKNEAEEKPSDTSNLKQEQQAFATGQTNKSPESEGHKNPAEKIDKTPAKEAGTVGATKGTVDKEESTTDSTDRSEGSNVGYGAAALGAGYAAVGGAISYLSGGNKESHPVDESYNKGVESGAYDEGAKAGEARQRTAPNSEELSSQAYSEGAKRGAYEAGTVKAAKEVSSNDKEAEAVSGDAYSEGAKRGAYEAGNVKAAKDVSSKDRAAEAAGVTGAAGAAGTVAGASEKQKSSHLSNEDYKKFYQAGVEKRAYEEGKAAAHSSHAHHSSKSAGTATGAAAGAATGAGLGAAGHSRSTANPEKEALLVEVIGVADRDDASKIARQASKDLREQGVDLSSGKLVINANTKEVYKTDADAETVPHQSGVGHHEASTVGAAGAAGVAAGAAGASAGGPPQTGFGSGDKSLKEDDIEIPPRSDLTSADPSQPSKYHNAHEKAKERLSEAAHQGNLGNVPAPESQSHAGSGVGAATGTGLASAAGHSHSGHEHQSSKPKPTNDVVVNVHGSKSNEDATKTATNAIRTLKHDQPETLAKVQKIEIDSKTGVVTDEQGQYLANIPGEKKNAASNTHSSSSAPNPAVASASTAVGSNTAYDSRALHKKPDNVTDINPGRSHGAHGTHGTDVASHGLSGGADTSSYDSSALKKKPDNVTDIYAGKSANGLSGSENRDTSYDSAALNKKPDNVTDIYAGKSSHGTSHGASHGLSSGNDNRDTSYGPDALNNKPDNVTDIYAGKSGHGLSGAENIDTSYDSAALNKKPDNVTDINAGAPRQNYSLGSGNAASNQVPRTAPKTESTLTSGFASNKTEETDINGNTTSTPNVKIPGAFIS